MRCSRRRPTGQLGRRVEDHSAETPPLILSWLIASRRTSESKSTLQVTVTEVGKASSHFFVVVTVTTALHCCSMSGPGGVCSLQRQTYRRGVRARRAVLSPFQVNRPAKSRVHIPSGLLIRGISRSDCLVSKASDFAIRAKFYCFYVASNRWYRGNMPPYSPEGRQFDPSWARRWRSSR